MEMAASVPERTPFLRNLARVMIHPRRTIRSVLAAPRDRAVLPLVLLAVLSAFLRDFNIRDTEAAIQLSGSSYLPLFMIGVIAASALILVGVFYLFSWIVFVVGRAFDGEGNAREVRSALAWGLAPFVWALLYRFPAALLVGATGDASRLEVPYEGVRIGLSLDRFADGCGPAALLSVAEVVLLAWFTIVSSLTVAEAHRVSGWSGLGTLLFSITAPVLAVIAALIALR